MKPLKRVSLAAIVVFVSIISVILLNHAAAQSKEAKEPAGSTMKTSEPGSPIDGPVPPAAQSAGDEISEWQARWELARLLSYSKRYAESLTEYEKLLKEKPDLWQAKTEMATVLFWNDQPDRALEMFKQIPPNQMTDPTRLVLADLYVAQKEYSKAEPLFRAYLEKVPDDQSVRLKLADLLSYQKLYKESINLYEIILKAHPDDIQVRRKYALVLSWAGQKERAVKELQKTLE